LNELKSKTGGKQPTQQRRTRRNIRRSIRQAYKDGVLTGHQIVAAFEADLAKIK
jgi:hypothetical protein